MEYLVENAKYSFSYQELREKWIFLCGLPDEEFMKVLPEALHLACIICYLKGRGNEVLSDKGIIHELAHLIHIPQDTNLKEVRKMFNAQLMLAA